MPELTLVLVIKHMEIIREVVPLFLQLARLTEALEEPNKELNYCEDQ